MEIALEISQFYKHCMNISENSRTSISFVPYLCDWKQCYITPYLSNNKIIHKNEPPEMYNELHWDSTWNYKNSLICTIEDYIKYINDTYRKNTDTIERSNKLIKILKRMPEKQIIDLIQIYGYMFPSETDTITNTVLPEKWNNHFIKYKL